MALQNIKISKQDFIFDSVNNNYYKDVIINTGFSNIFVSPMENINVWIVKVSTVQVRVYTSAQPINDLSAIINY